MLPFETARPSQDGYAQLYDGSDDHDTRAPRPRAASRRSALVPRAELTPRAVTTLEAKCKDLELQLREATKNDYVSMKKTTMHEATNDGGARSSCASVPKIATLQICKFAIFAQIPSSGL